MKKTKIEWCDSSWNPVSGCGHVCQYCYARKMVNRFSKSQDVFEFAAHQEGIGNDGLYAIDDPWTFESRKQPYPFGFNPTLHRYRLNVPMKWSEGRNIFVCSMADLFGDWVPDGWINEVMKACAEAPQHNYLFLTKNPARYRDYFDKPRDQINEDCNFTHTTLFLGTTVTNQKDINALFDGQLLQELDFLSMEPLQGSISFNQYLEYESDNSDWMLKWVIIGAETGNRKDKIIPDKEWINSITEQCDEYHIPVFMKDSLVPIVGEENMRREFPMELEKKA